MPQIHGPPYREKERKSPSQAKGNQYRQALTAIVHCGSLLGLGLVNAFGKDAGKTISCRCVLIYARRMFGSFWLLDDPRLLDTTAVQTSSGWKYKDQQVMSN